MKLSKDELIKKVNEKVMDEDVKIELMEDITDSFDVVEAPKDDGKDERIFELEEQVKTLREKYKERFLSGTKEKEEEEIDEGEKIEEEYIDVKEI